MGFKHFLDCKVNIYCEQVSPTWSKQMCMILCIENTENIELNDVTAVNNLLRRFSYFFVNWLKTNHCYQYNIMIYMKITKWFSNAIATYMAISQAYSYIVTYLWFIHDRTYRLKILYNGNNWYRKRYKEKVLCSWQMNNWL